MPVFSGNTSTSAISTAFALPATIRSFSITNKSAGAVTVNASILLGSTNIWITPLNVSLAAGEMYKGTEEITLLIGEIIYVLVSGSCDYYFNIS